MSIGDTNKRFILDFYGSYRCIDKHQLSMIVNGRPSFFCESDTG